MDAVEYLKQRARMAVDCNYGYCDGCMLSRKRNGKGVGCGEMERSYPEESVEIVENWAKEHPVETYKSVFLEKFPDAAKEDGVPVTCVVAVFGEKKKPEGCYNGITCSDCWTREVEEVWESNTQKCLSNIFDELLDDTTIVDPVGGNQGREILTNRVIKRYKKVELGGKRLKKVKMTVSTGMANSKISETVEMADDMSKEDIDCYFEEWVWDQIDAHWEVEEN